MEGLCVKGQRVKCNRFGKPLIESFLKLLLPDPAGRGDREKALAITDLDYIDDLRDYVSRLARKLKTKQKYIWQEISFEESFNRRKRSSSSLEEDDDVLEQEEQEEDDDEIVSNEDNARAQDSEALAHNTSVLRSLSMLMSQTDRETESEYMRLLKDTSLPFIKAVREHGPVVTQASQAPEKHGERLFGVSQRIEALGVRVPAGQVGVVGKRALELYREEYPGHTPPQRVVINEHGHEYLMNQYTESTARKTLDVAIREQQQQKKRK